MVSERSVQEIVEEEFWRVAGDWGLDIGVWMLEVAAARPAQTAQPPQSPQSPHSPTSRESTTAATATTALKTYATGLGAAPLVKGLIKLFGGGKAEPPPALIRFALPPALRIQAANPSGPGRFEFLDYSQEGKPRVWETRATPHITVEVNAMDSRSFLDHSSEIARAVREAMLNMHAVNDVVNDL